MKLRSTTEADADDGVPGVVYIDAPEVVVRGEFYANILLTEQPMGNTFPVIVDGGKGTAGDPEWLTSVSPEVLRVLPLLRVLIIFVLISQAATHKETDGIPPQMISESG